MPRHARKHIPPSDMPEVKRARNLRNRLERERRERYPNLYTEPEDMGTVFSDTPKGPGVNQAAAGSRWP